MNDLEFAGRYQYLPIRCSGRLISPQNEHSIYLYINTCVLAQARMNYAQLSALHIRRTAATIRYLSAVLHNCLAFLMPVNMQRCFLLVHSLFFITCFSLMWPSSGVQLLTGPVVLLCCFCTQFWYLGHVALPRMCYSHHFSVIYDVYCVFCLMYVIYYCSLFCYL
jgi:hypothetical protein